MTGGGTPRFSIGPNAIRVVALTLLAIAVVVALLIVAAARTPTRSTRSSTTSAG